MVTRHLVWVPAERRVLGRPSGRHCGDSHVRRRGPGHRQHSGRRGPLTASSWDSRLVLQQSGPARPLLPQCPARGVSAAECPPPRVRPRLRPRSSRRIPCELEACLPQAQSSWGVYSCEHHIAFGRSRYHDVLTSRSSLSNVSLSSAFMLSLPAVKTSATVIFAPAGFWQITLSPELAEHPAEWIVQPRRSPGLRCTLTVVTSIAAKFTCGSLPLPRSGTNWIRRILC